MELAGRDLFERCCMENEIHSSSSIQNTLIVANVTDVELELRIGEALAHIILFFFIPTKDSNFVYIGIEKAT